MLTGKSGTKGNVLVVQLAGAIDEDANLASAVGTVPPPPTELHINCAQVTKINSIGIKAWVGFFEKLSAKGNRILFWDCPPHIIQQVNLVQNFTCGGKVMSLQLAYACESCNNSFTQTISVGEAAKIAANVPNQKCPKCGAEAVFDDMPEIYFRFLNS